jgi:hypothetical protein
LKQENKRENGNLIGDYSLNIMNTQKIFLALIATMLFSSFSIVPHKLITNEKKPQYVYITAFGSNGYEMHRLYSNVFVIPDDKLSDSQIEVPFYDVVKVKYGSKYYMWGSYQVWRYKTKSEAEKARTKDIGDIKADGWKIEYINNYSY